METQGKTLALFAATFNFWCIQALSLSFFNKESLPKSVQYLVHILDTNIWAFSSKLQSIKFPGLWVLTLTFFHDYRHFDSGNLISAIDGLNSK